MPDDLTGLCAELAALYRALEAAGGPDPHEAPDRSNQARPALLWCLTHQASHRRTEWRQPVFGPPPRGGWCEPGQDPRRASVRVAPTLAATAPKWSQTRKAYGPSSPTDLDALAVWEDVRTEAVALARHARRELGDKTRHHDPVQALAALPALLSRLPGGHLLHRRTPAVLAALRRRARWALDLDRRPFPLYKPCPSPRQPYAATWAPSDDGSEWVAVAEWDDGECREYDVELSRPGAEPPVDVWRASMLYVRDSGAAPESEDAAPRCPGCRRAWVGAEGRAQLYALLRPELAEAPNA